ncbi:MAG: prepilin-type N-terminal cleavage/methylation domain-containing protein [Burkholderiales bacterium]|nr:prepilin-type N-terminal cleavage/methylation domain-containing protein [Burkholderiales bacterium]
MASQRKQTGFTLIEIAIVLVIIGLLLGGILKGQELITSARVRSLISQQDGIKASFYGFQDRFRALPGDYSQAGTNIQMTTTGANANGNGNGRIDGTTPDETILVWEHLSKSGFINGNYVYNATISDTNTPKNAYGQYVELGYDANYYILTGGVAAVSTVNRHNLKTGNQIPVEIVAEVDRKIDDGNGATGSFVFSVYTTPTGTAPTAPGAAPNCMSTAGAWNLVGQTAINCGGSSLM